MSKLTSENELSMEEVLASIRRIIADDVGVNDIHQSIPRPPQENFKSPSLTTPILNESILDLTDVLSHDGTVIRLKPRQEREEAMMSEPKLALNPNDSAEDVLDLVEVEENKQNHLGSLSYHPQVDSAPSASQEEIFSQETAQKTVAALKGLNKLNDKVHEMISDGSFGQQTMEEFMLAIMKPMLKTWMDSHLPSLVKWVVAEQIEKLLREKQESVTS